MKTVYDLCEEFNNCLKNNEWNSCDYYGITDDFNWLEEKIKEYREAIEEAHNKELY